MKKSIVKNDSEMLDIELFNLFRDLYPNSESYAKAVYEAKKASSFLKKQRMQQCDLDDLFLNDFEN